MTSIPRELLPKILAKIGLRDKATLLACHAVSRDLRIATRAILFSNIILELPPDDPTKELQDFYEFVAARPYVGTSIRHLRINGTTGGVLEDAEVEDTDGDYHERAQAARGPYNCKVDITPLYRTLPLLDKIETLKLYHVLPPSSVDRTSIQAIQIHVPEVSIAIPSFDSEEEVAPWDPDDVYKEEAEEQEREDIRGTKLLFNILSAFDSIGKLSIMTRPHVFDLVNYLGVDDTPPNSVPSHLKVGCLWLESGNDSFWKYLSKLQFVRELRGVEIGWNIREENVRRLHDVVQLSSATLEYLKLRAIHKYDYFDLSTCRNLQILAIHVYIDAQSFLDFISFVSLASENGLRNLQVVIFELRSFLSDSPEVLENTMKWSAGPAVDNLLLRLADRKLRKVEWRCHSTLCATVRKLLPKLHSRDLLTVTPDDTLRYDSP